MVLFLTFCTDPERHNAQRYRRTDRQMDDIVMPYCVAVRSAQTTIKVTSVQPIV